MGKWSLAPGVVELPDGRRVLGSSLRGGRALDVEPNVGFYLLAKEPAPTAWPVVWIRWPDFRLPSDEARTFAALTDAFDRCVEDRVEIACGGGRGRTGCAIAVLGVLGGIQPEVAVTWVRAVYNQRAVETPWQRRWIRGLDASRIRAAA